MINQELESCGCPKGTQCFCIRKEDEIRRPCGCPVIMNCRCINPYLVQHGNLTDQCVYDFILPSGKKLWLKWDDNGGRFKFPGGMISSQTLEEVNNTPLRDVKITRKVGIIGPQR